VTTDGQGVTPEDLRHLARAVARAAKEVGGGFGQLIQGWSDSMMLLATGFDQNLRAGASAERVSIALMAQARKLYDSLPTNPTPIYTRDLADRLASWSSDVRQLGVEHFRHRESHKAQRDEAVEKLARAEAKLGRVRELIGTRIAGAAAEAVREAIDE
jgi:hypothetical protein